MRILLVEDAPRLRQSVAMALRRTGYAVDTAGDGEEALWRAGATDYDAIVLDIMLPKLDGLTVLRRLRDAGRPTHVLLLTARDTVSDRVAGLRAGADDYLIKPFALEELLARVQALCRRTYGAKQSSITIGALVLDLDARRVRLAGAGLDLTPREFALLEYLARRRGQIVSRTEIEAHIYDEQVAPMSNVVDSTICALRKKLGAPFICTRRGHGYGLDVLPAESPRR